MRKIREFNLRLPFKEIRRRARQAADLNAMGLDDPKLQLLIEVVQRRLRPAVIFASFGPESRETAALAPIPGLAHTLGLATLGPDIAPLIAETRTENEQRGGLLELVAAVALERAVQFVTGLLRDEVESERCELSPIQHLDEAEAVSAVLERLGGGKIGLKLEAGRLSPEHSTAFCLSWIARKGRRRKSKTRASSGSRDR
ncbi:MAG: hypothetical protein ABII00_05980 [Elusimicrobiota bacterium]